MAFTDNFTRANEDLSASPNWTVVSGGSSAAVISSNQLAVSTSQASGLIVCPDQGSADHYIEWTLQGSFTYSYVACRATDGDNWIGVRGWDNKIQLAKNVAGTLTVLSEPLGVTNGDTIRFECSGNTLTVDRNGSEVINVTDAFNNTETRQGIVPIDGNQDPWIDNFEAGSGAATASITNIDGDNSVYQGQASVVITCSGTPSTVTTWSADISGDSLTKVSWNSGNPQVTIPVGTTLRAGNGTLNVTYTE